MKTDAESFTEHYSFSDYYPELAEWTAIDQKEVFTAAQPFILTARHGKSNSAVMKARATLRRLAKSATYTSGMIHYRNGQPINTRWAS